MAVEAAMYHSKGDESDQQKRNLEMYWYEIPQTAASCMSAKVAAPILELPRREKGDEGRGWTGWARGIGMDGMGRWRRGWTGWEYLEFVYVVVSCRDVVIE